MKNLRISKIEVGVIFDSKIFDFPDFCPIFYRLCFDFSFIFQLICEMFFSLDFFDFFLKQIFFQTFFNRSQLQG